MRLVYIMACLFVIGCIGSQAYAHGWIQNEQGEMVPHEHDSNCPPDCTVGTPEHDAWWCSAKTVKTDCEVKDKVNCEWANSQCKPKDGS